jgi:hypothetical protein
MVVVKGALLRLFGQSFNCPCLGDAAQTASSEKRPPFLEQTHAFLVVLLTAMDDCLSLRIVNR